MLIKRILLAFMFLLPVAVMSAADRAGVDSSGIKYQAKELFNATIFKHNSKDSLTRARHKKTFFHRLGNTFTCFFREFSHVDTTYIEPQKYIYTAMLQNTNTYEVYHLKSKSGQNITFAPEMSYRLGPYLGWRWIFLGYTLDLTHISRSDRKKNKSEIDLSLYSSMFGIDFFWRETGNNYKIRSINLGDRIDTSPLEGNDFDGVQASIKGFNIYYIFNHHKFSYPAAYSQSTRQKRSAGSPLLGIGYTRQSLSVDWEKLGSMIEDRLNTTSLDAGIDSSLLFSKVKYTDISISGGYSYNWVFAHNWLFNASLSLALAYKQSYQDMQKSHFTMRDFKFSNFNIDGIGRFGLVYNNMKWYAGASAILHSYNYRKSNFSTNNFFGSVNFYIGFNFGK